MVVDSTIRFNDRMDGPSVSLGSKLSNAKVSFAIFKRDIKRLLVNPVALVVTLGVCVIPSLYAWYNIVANWDPYGNTQGIKIAIANNDRGTQNDLVGELNAGDHVKVDAENGKFLFEHGPRGEKVAVGVGAAGAIEATPDIVAGG